MNKDYFLRELRYLLGDISEEERREALQYYEDYLAEAGPEREQEILEKLGSPEKVAAEIRSGLSGTADGGEFTERGYRDERFEAKSQVPDQYTEIVAGEVVDDRKEESCDGRFRRAGRRFYEYGNSRTERKYRRSDGGEYASGRRKNEWARDGEDGQELLRRRRKGGLIALILFLIFGLPLAGSIVGAGFSIVAALAGCVFGIFGGLIGLIVGGFAMVAGLFAAGIGMIVTGFCNMVTPALGTTAVGGGFFLLALSLLLLAAVKWGCATVVPGFFRFCIDLVGACFRFVGNLARKIFGGGNRR